MFMDPLPWATYITFFVVLFIWTQQEKETTRSPDLRQMKYVALVVLKRICHKQFGIYIKWKAKQASFKQGSWSMDKSLEYVSELLSKSHSD